ncbi:excitatory amino acid transporter 4-like [Peromyscus maniculatus bairdii]|uniref:excitatory amino acid transporter 4-like n=1 Tax=Peromyscus maniculatus bairdii TaxID=230844 RepID=UPI003FD034D7
MSSHGNSLFLRESSQHLGGVGSLQGPQDSWQQRALRMHMSLQPMIREHVWCFLPRKAFFLLTVSNVIIGELCFFALCPHQLFYHQIKYFSFPGELLMRMLQMLVLPVIVSSLVTGMASLDKKATGRMGMRAAVHYMVTTVIVVFTGILMVTIIHLGKGSKEGLHHESQIQTVPTAHAFMDLVRNMFPPNLVEACFKQREAMSSHGNSLFLRQSSQHLGGVGSLQGPQDSWQQRALRMRMSLQPMIREHVWRFLPRKAFFLLTVSNVIIGELCFCELLMRMLQMLVLPLIVSSLVTGALPFLIFQSSVLSFLLNSHNITATTASVGAAGIPQAGLVTMVIVLTSISLPTEDILLIIAVDWFLDWLHMMTNVLGASIEVAVIENLYQQELELEKVELTLASLGKPYKSLMAQEKGASRGQGAVIVGTIKGLMHSLGQGPHDRIISEKALTDT